MAYIRRYLSGQQATTVVIAEGAITSDKIVDGAVTHPKVAPGAIDSERVVDGSLKSEDIQDGQIKTVDLAPNAVTTDKILDGAVTSDKLESSLQGITRPLTPGVDTVEIQDAKVTLAKLAPNSVDASKIKPGAVGPTELDVDAVEESRVKDGAITRDKIAGSAIDATKIAVDAVTGSEILNGYVGVTELATDAVQTVKVKDRNITSPKIGLENIIPELIAPDAVETDKILDAAVTEPKLNVAALAARHKESYLTRVIEHTEDFCGNDISNKWVKTGAAGGAVYPEIDRGLRITSGAVSGNDQRIDFGGKTIGALGTTKPKMTVYIPIQTSSLNYSTHQIGLWRDANNYVIFYAHDDAGALPNWFAKCVSGGVPTAVDTTIPITADTQLLSIDVIDATHVKFYIDGFEVAEITTNIPNAEVVEPRIEIIARTAEIRRLYVKYFSLLATRPDYV